MRTWVSACFLAIVAAALPAQVGYSIGTCDVAWPNTSGLGTPVLTARVHYPAVVAGQNAPVLPSAAGWPAVVFLHGYSLIGSDYTAIADVWARAGFVVVLSETAQFNYLDQESDGRAMFAAILAANATSGTTLSGAFDTQQIALAGHSMGGGTTGLVLADNPGYVCGLSLSPVSPGPVVATQITVPFGIVVGTGDTITPWQIFALPFFAAVGSTDGLKFLYLMNNDCDHLNIAGLTSVPTTQVFDRAADLGLCFLRHFMRLDVTALERVVGPAALSDPRLVELMQQVAVPQVWTSTPLRVGRWSRFSVAAERGFGGILAALATGPGVMTSIGILNLDPGTAFTLAAASIGPDQRFDVFLQVPNDPTLIGLPVALQAVGATTTSTLSLGSTLQLHVMP